MLRQQLCLHGLLLLLVLTACAVRNQVATPGACRRLADGADLQDCLDTLADGARLDLPVARIVLAKPLVLSRRVTLTTAGTGPDSAGCDQGGCAVLALRLTEGFESPISVAGAGSVIDHVVIEGGKADPSRHDDGACAGSGRRSMGGLSITGRQVTVSHSVVRDVSCFSAVEVAPGAEGFRFIGNAVLGNGTHDRAAMWADGLTLLDGVNDVVRGNLFRDNTDVQLVLGGCLRCTIADNRIETSDRPDAGAFTALLVHGWPLTSGDFDGTVISGNVIDCGAGRRCGFGLGVGGRAWYKTDTAGGLIAGNIITRAGVGINVNDATGRIAMRDNTVTQSGGPVRSHCGLWFAGAVNITHASQPYVDPTAGVQMPAEGVTERDFHGCLPGT